MEASFGWVADGPSQPLVDAGYAGVLLVVTGGLAWATGEAFVFPSLGPIASLLATDHTERQTGRRVLGGHLIGVVAGLVPYQTITSGLAIVPAAPACATTPIVSFGLRSTGREPAFVVSVCLLYLVHRVGEQVGSHFSGCGRDSRA